MRLWQNGAVSLEVWVRKRSVVSAYRRVLRRCEREMSRLPSPAGPGASVRPRIAKKVLTLMAQVSRTPAISGMGGDPQLQRRLKPFEQSFENLAERARRVIEEGGRR